MTTHAARSVAEPDDERGLFNKVAQITVFFWIMKILATTLGETAGDYLSMSLNLGYRISLGITFGALVAILAVQMGNRRFHPAIYWLAIIATTTAGTEVSDLMDRTLGLGYTGGSALLLTGLLVTLALWHMSERSLSVYPVTKRRVELYYWVAIIFSNSLGTAFGDFLTDTAGLGYLTGAAVTAGVIGLVVALHYGTRINEVFLFWIAFIFTRPFGATFGDLLTKPLDHGGLNLPRDLASGVTLFLLGLTLVISIWAQRRGVTRDTSEARLAPAAWGERD